VATSTEIDGKTVREGDRIRFTGEGVVKFAYLDGPRVKMDGYAGTWWINDGHKVDIPERARTAAEPKDLYTVVEGTAAAFGNKFRYVKTGDNKWVLQTAEGSRERTWAWLLDNYSNGDRLMVLTPTTRVK
jgi:hypothetical protein